MAFNHDAAAAARAKKAAQDLTAVGIKLPEPAVQALNTLDTLIRTAPRQPSNHKLVEAIRAGNEAVAGAAAIELATYEHRRDGHAAAITQQAHAALDAIRAGRRPIGDALTALAREHLDRIAAADALGDVTLEALVNGGRADDAAVFAAAPAHRQALEKLRALSERHLGQPLTVPTPK